MEIEDRFEIDIPINLVSDMTTVADLVALVERQIATREGRLMDIFDKYAQYAQRHQQLLSLGADPFAVRLDELHSATEADIGGRTDHPRRHQQLSRPDLRSGLHRRRRSGAAPLRHRHHRLAHRQRQLRRCTPSSRPTSRGFCGKTLVHGVQHRLPGQSRHDRRARRPARRGADRCRFPCQHLRRLQAVGGDHRPLPAQRPGRSRQAPDAASRAKASASW